MCIRDRSPLIGQGGGLGGVDRGPVHDHHLLRTGVGQGQDDRPGRATGTDDQTPPPGGIEAGPAPHRLDEPGTVGGVPHQTPGGPGDAVHDAETAGHGGALVDHDGRILLVGHRHRQPDDTEGPHPNQGVSHPTGGHGKGHRHPVEALSLIHI